MIIKNYAKRFLVKRDLNEKLYFRIFPPLDSEQKEKLPFLQRRISSFLQYTQKAGGVQGDKGCGEERDWSMNDRNKWKKKIPRGRGDWTQSAATQSH